MQKGYENTNYRSKQKLGGKVFILRHDIDFSLDKALEIARLEKNLNVKSTYFVLLTSDFYNVFSKKTVNLLNEMIHFGHEIGLHFDEKRYQIEDVKDLEKYIEYESNILGELLGRVVKVVSMHRPSDWVLKGNFRIKSYINAYSKEFLYNYKYLSDSRMHWREDVMAIINSGKYNRLHILTHPFWYASVNGNLQSRIKSFIDQAKEDRRIHVFGNISNPEQIFGPW